ncbi:Carbamoyl-phosphate synthase L chain ATP-binding protein [Thermodesulfatator indicus DSM 15286]|uniref:Carbamoyl-phosphate synthase L chain ATP-binding protein n=1 Tax=Thermodesulfatator indicus (strain DSM 15286 / JCM 11887 / CIR29812) TaxID=667014 RepID=F8ADA4_THEID|nr:biotin carboxylase N-terminal domain-containing protein [Thermodesulfatator indicus]AEH44845.1 Carbamoyl-phosphate synthase L chain ATP-binding protein [Thermodesulfatator indicus DSM 15286]
MERKISHVLIANRGVPAVRIMDTCRDRRIKTTAVYSTADRLAYHVRLADQAVCVGEAPPLESYLNMENIIKAALQVGADAIHPGWGFLAENADFAEMVQDAGLVWIGPSPEVIRAMGDKVEAKKYARRANVPSIPGIDNVSSIEDIKKWIEEEKVDFPIMLKAAKGGGGKGMVKVESEEELPIAFNQAKSEAMKAFGDDTLLAEKYISHSRHIEVQVIADTHGKVIHLYERECTLQRRNQKIIEEAPSPTLDDDLREEICFTAVRLMREIGYTSAGTVEFIFDTNTNKFYFLEVNTRLQVEHGITELITGLDIVGLMLDVAEGKKLPVKQSEVKVNRWALEARLNAEDPFNFNPSFGTITRLQLPQGPAVRISQGVYEGADIPPYYDSLIMLIMTAGQTREAAIMTMDRALGRDLRVEGIKTIAPLLLAIIRHPSFRAGKFSTTFIEEHMNELVSMFKEKSTEDEVLKIAKFVARVSALGPQPWM